MAQDLSALGEDAVTEAQVSWPADVLRAVETGKAFAASLGFTADQCEEIALVISELAANLIRHAPGGVLQFDGVESGGRPGIEIRSVDRGAGISDIDRALTDGYSTVGGLGLGLGTVNRLVDELDFAPEPGGGLRVVARRWLRPQTSGIALAPLAFGMATRSWRNLPENGDAVVFKRWETSALLGVIDGLGHGPLAQRAALTARRYVEHHFDQPLQSLFRGAGRACQGTRGVVMALARFDLTRQSLVLASVGTIETRLVGSPERLNLIVRRGIVGMNAPEAVPAQHPWTPESILIMHSDGLGSHWDWNRFRHLERDAPDVIARRLLADLGKADDDATVIVARSGR